MAIKVKNISEKIIGVGDVTILPDESKEIPVAFERSPILEIYKEIGLINITGKLTSTEPIISNSDTDGFITDEERKTKLDSLKDASDEDVAALAKELGINPADCKDLADVRKKVKAALSK